jgi:hypothetical protein
MNQELINWASKLHHVLFHDGRSHGVVKACENNTVEIEVEEELTMIVGPQPTDTQALPTGRWYNWQDEGYFLCVRFRQFIKDNPFPRNLPNQ